MDRTERWRGRGEGGRTIGWEIGHGDVSSVSGQLWDKHSLHTPHAGTWMERMWKISYVSGTANHSTRCSTCTYTCSRLSGTADEGKTRLQSLPGMCLPLTPYILHTLHHTHVYICIPIRIHLYCTMHAHNVYSTNVYEPTQVYACI